MTALSEKIAAEHLPGVYPEPRCSCGDTNPFVTHLIDVTERAVREQITGELDGTWTAWLDLHRGLHDLGRVLTAPLHRLIDRTIARAYSDGDYDTARHVASILDEKADELEREDRR